MKFPFFVGIAILSFVSPIFAAPTATAKPAQQKAAQARLDEALLDAVMADESNAAKRPKILRLLARGAKPSSGAFGQAIQYGDLAVLEAFARAKAPLPSRPFPYVDGQFQNAEGIYRWLLRHGAKPDFDALDTAMQAKRAPDKLLRLLLDAGADPNARGWWTYFADDKVWATPLMVAAHWAGTPGYSGAQFSDGRMIKMLLARGARINDRTKDGRNALDFALVEDFEAPTNARVLLEQGAEVRPSLGPRLLQIAAGCNFPSIIDELDKRKLLPTKLSIVGLHLPTGSGIVRKLLAHGADPNEADDKGWTTLHAAAEASEFESVKALLDAGANIEAKGVNPSIAGTMLEDATPLFFADAQNFSEHQLKNNPAMRLLLERGADPNARDKNGVTPLIFAALGRDRGFGSEEAARLLCAHGADVTAKDKGGSNALHYAVSWSDAQWVSVTQTLLQTNSTPEFLEARDAGGNTAFLVAVASQGKLIRTEEQGQFFRFPILDAMLRSRADKGARDSDGNGAYHLAQEADGRLDVLLAAKVPGLDIPNNEGATPLFKACWNGEVEVARWLLHHGANPDRAAKNGLSARQVANCPMEVGAFPIMSSSEKLNLDRNLEQYLGKPELVRMFRKQMSAQLKPQVDKSRKHIAALIQRIKPKPTRTP